ncbi:transporter substrate-binding domain-containing protein [Longirhabdus pacifica]|uniref:transporter substrate-binding domain-containing protein n=1 Tax=Longirhabdus pacifica TaxID=2305227 RepID=UPI0010087950|nr:transporter substrate-binding domain-containing protein [Longirhabdus pacifica]
MKKKYFLMTTFMLAIMLMFTACGQSDDASSEETDQGTAQSEETNVMIMGTSADYPPFEDVDIQTEEIVGIDVDIAKAVMEELGYELEIKNMDFNGLIAALQSERVDFVMSGMSVTDERKESVDFSDMYFEATNTIVTTVDADIASLEDLAGKKVGVQLGSLQETRAVELGTIEDIVSLDKIPALIQEIKSDRIDAIIMEDSIAKGFVAANEDLQMIAIEGEKADGYAVAFPKDAELTAEFNAVLKDMLDSGQIDEIIQSWIK